MAGGTIAVSRLRHGQTAFGRKALEHVAGGKPVVVTADPAVLAAAERVVVPGQGAMPDCMRELEERGLRQAVIEAAATQALPRHLHRPADALRAPEEGDVPGLGILRGR